MKRNQNRRRHSNNYYILIHLAEKVGWIVAWWTASMFAVEAIAFIGSMLHTGVVAIWNGINTDELMQTGPAYCSIVQLVQNFDFSHSLIKGGIMAIAVYIAWWLGLLAECTYRKYRPHPAQQSLLAVVLLVGHEVLELVAYLVEFLLQAAGQWLTGKEVITLASTLSQYHFNFLATLCQVLVIMLGIFTYFKCKRHAC